MKKLAAYAIFTTGILLGSWMPKGFFFPSASAKPSEVVGSANVAVDTYHNVSGTFTLYSDGSIKLVTGTDPGLTALSNQDLGTPYAAPALGASILTATPTPGKPAGSPHVALKAITRSDGTYILFADGSLMVPGNKYARAASAVPGRVFSVSTPTFGPNNPMPDGWTGTTADATMHLSGGTFTMTLPDALTGITTALGYVTIYNTGIQGGLIESVTLPGTVSSDGKTIAYTFGVFTNQWNPSETRVLYFSANVSGD